MKRIILSLIFVLLSINSFAQTVSYTYKPLAAEGCHVEYTTSWQDKLPYLIVKVRSDRMKFVEEPVLLFKTFDDETIKLYGFKLDTETESYSHKYNSYTSTSVMYEASAQFLISEHQIESLNKGISKVRIYLIPMNHERKFKKDKIGRKLYKAFMKDKRSNEVF